MKNYQKLKQSNKNTGLVYGADFSEANIISVIKKGLREKFDGIKTGIIIKNINLKKL